MSEQANPAEQEAKCLNEEELANVTGGGGIFDVLVKGYSSTPLRFYAEGGTKPTAIKPLKGWIDQDPAGQPGGRTSVLYTGGNKQLTFISVPNPRANPQG